MGEYTGRIEIARPPGEVFAFLSDLRNMPHYLPTVSHVGRLGHHDDHADVAVEGEAGGHHYHNDGWMKAEPETHRMSWGSHTLADYHGMLAVTASGAGSIVDLNLTITTRPAVAERMRAEHGSVDRGMRLSLERTLASIKACCEMPPVARDAANDDTDLHDSRPFGSSATPGPEI